MHIAFTLWQLPDVLNHNFSPVGKETGNVFKTQTLQTSRPCAEKMFKGCLKKSTDPVKYNMPLLEDLDIFYK